MTLRRHRLAASDSVRLLALLTRFGDRPVWDEHHRNGVFHGRT